ncbi:hypothetical protein K7X08_010603 [Anisodus acutangulus]|uniref:Uncharacterized protein n=1 Tax=Anisodus acutangulus TaxID=402998 RepID=A0A9Q1LX84_9SOLA|nr:hypothetical protein K7X08_010603 [Anisodus acutangulus]
MFYCFRGARLSLQRRCLHALAVPFPSLARSSIEQWNRPPQGKLDLVHWQESSKIPSLYIWVLFETIFWLVLG